MTECVKCNAPNDMHLCRRCIGKLQESAQTIVHYAEDLEAEIARQSRKTAPSPKGGAEPDPINFYAAECKKQLKMTLSWLNSYLKRPTAAKDLPKLAVYVRKHSHELRSLDLGKSVHIAKLIEQLGNSTRRMMKSIDSVTENILYGYCPHCGKPIHGPRGKQYAYCSNCNNHHIDTDVMKRAMQEAVKDRLSDTLLSAELMAEAMTLIGYKVTGNQIRNWGKRGHVTEHEGHKFAFDDVLDQVEERHLKAA